MHYSMCGAMALGTEGYTVFHALNSCFAGFIQLIVCNLCNPSGIEPCQYENIYTVHNGMVNLHVENVIKDRVKFLCNTIVYNTPTNAR